GGDVAGGRRRTARRGASHAGEDARGLRAAGDGRDPGRVCELWDLRRLLGLVLESEPTALPAAPPAPGAVPPPAPSTTHAGTIDPERRGPVPGITFRSARRALRDLPQRRRVG